MSQRIHHMTHPTIKFSSMNSAYVRYWEGRLTGISADDIRLDTNLDRHRLMLNMSLDGHSPLSEEYFEVRDARYKMLESRMSKIPKSSSRYILVRSPISYEVDDNILHKYGWDFTKEPR